MAAGVVTARVTFAGEAELTATYDDVGSDNFGILHGKQDSVNVWIEKTTPAPTRTSCKVKVSGAYNGPVDIVVVPR